VLKIPHYWLRRITRFISKKEDFMTLLSGVMGQKKRIHMHIGDVLNTEIDKIKRRI
jgi:hypothetical protein